MYLFWWIVDKIFLTGGMVGILIVLWKLGVTGIRYEVNLLTGQRTYENLNQFIIIFVLSVLSLVMVRFTGAMVKKEEEKLTNSNQENSDAK